MIKEDYFELLKSKLQEAYACASAARSKGFDPSDEVEIKIAKDVAARVEGIVGPPGITEIIRKMERDGLSREMVAFEIAQKIAAGEIIKGTKGQLIEQAVRTGVGILTEGVLVAPTEGISKVSIKNNPDGSDYVAVYYSGPIRSAGGTAAALSVVLADVARKTAGIGDYRATDSQIERYVEEVNTYEARIAHLQYKPPDDDIRLITQNCPVCIDGEPTEDIEVSVYRSIQGVETNRIRGGIPLVICEGIAQKAAKLFKYTKKLELGWDWLEKIIKVKRTADKIELKADSTYLEGLVAGRPVFAYPSAKGGFRLRYGRSRTNGIMAKNIHPATMVLLDGFLAYGTHMKIERPGKGCVVSSCEEIEPPVVKLKNGSVIKVRTIQEAEKIKEDVIQILFLGDILVTFGDFIKSNHPLIPSGWCEEWWQRELEAKGVAAPDGIKTNAYAAFEFSRVHSVPLHPEFTFNWENISVADLPALVAWIAGGDANFDGAKLKELRLPHADEKRILEDIFVEHRVVDGSKIVLGGEDAAAILLTLGMLKDGKIIGWAETGNVLQILGEDSIHRALEKLSGIVIKPKAPIYIGARMGRPEKAKERAMEGSPNVLFPTGSQKNRSLLKLYRTLKARDGEKTVLLEISRFKCKECSRITFSRKCDVCGGEAEAQKVCQKCNAITNAETHCEFKTTQFDRRPIEIVDLMENIKKKLGGVPEDIKGVKGLSNPTRVPERLEKGFLRAKHNTYVFRDGTSRFDATDVPLTYFIPREIKLTAEKAKELGYVRDAYGNPITLDTQLIPLKHQDVILSEAGAEYFFRVAKFIDEMLIELYGMKPFYNLESKEELIGHLAAGLSPHTSAAVLSRIIGITKANVGYAHPYFHSAKRRNCFHPETKIMIFNKNSRKLDVEIGTFFEMELQAGKAVKKLDADTEKILVDDEIFVESIDIKTKKIIKKRIKCLIRTKSPEYWLDIQLENGLKKIVTPDHNIIYCENDGLKHIEAKNARIGMKLPVKKNNTYEPKRIKKITQIDDDAYAYCLDIISKNGNLLEKNILLSNGLFSIRCDGDEDCLILLMDALINFSKKYLNETRGGTMDTPLVLTSMVNPQEVDDEVHSMELVNRYPLEFYHATEKMAFPGDIKIKTIKDVLGTPEEFEALPITHHCNSIDEGVIRTTYVQLESIPEKIAAQFKLQEKIRAVDQKDAAERLILSHFIPDLYGNLRSFSRQNFRCVNCNESYRRVPLVGKCIRCGGNLLLTINKGGIRKYLEISRKIALDYELPDYLKQRLDLLDKEIKSIFEDERAKQTGLSDFV